MSEENRLEQMREAAQQFHEENPEVWDLMERFAFEKIALGYEHFGIGAIWERIRWETATGADEPELKLNNNFRAFYARRFSKMYPDHSDFFRQRVQTSAMRSPSAFEEPSRFDL